jgi:FtsP/CotA-like multicopper oxidase with cupredoxin domain
MRLPLLALLAAGAAGLAGRAPTAEVRVVPNDNRVPAGTLRRDTLHLELVLQRAEWYPEAESGPHVTVAAFSEAGKAPSIPAPLIRVRAGTVIHATVRNALPDSTAHLVGLGSHPMPETDTLHVKPRQVGTATFLAGEPGTYLYRAIIGHDPDDREAEHETAGGAFVVDPVGGSPPDRIFVMNITFQPIDSIRAREALAINGKSWPYTETISATQGDSVRWRVLNGTARSHPMHLHGFYFKIEESGTGIASKRVDPAAQILAVTENMAKFTTRTLVWSPDRPGNWLFHCHLTFHVVPGARLTDGAPMDHQTHSTDPREHMAGLVLGISVAPRGQAVAHATPRPLDLWINQGGPRARMAATFSYILQQGSQPPALDSVPLVGTPLILTRGEPVDITVHNRSQQAGGIHWHGIELESWNDGVVGWSGAGAAVAPPVLPGGTFRARLLTPRAGTFMYHTHMNDIEQVTGGAVGAIVVLEPGQRFDPMRDHVLLAHWNGLSGDSAGTLSLLINGDSLARAPITTSVGVSHRFRLINIGPANAVRWTIRRDTTLATWTPVAKDGADLPLAVRRARPADVFVAVGEIYDFEFTPPTPGRYEIGANFGRLPPVWRQAIVVR